MFGKQENRKLIGFLAESFVADFLTAQGYELVDRNVQIWPGEIDLIVRKDNIYAFVEVKRRIYTQIAISGAITSTKKQSVIRAARRYMQHHRLSDQVIIRFDVAIVIGGNVGIFNPQLAEINYIENAYTLEGL